MEWYEKDIEEALVTAKRAARSNLSSLSEKGNPTDSSVADSNGTNNEPKPFIKRDNQKFGLIEALIEVGDWKSANSLLSRLSAINPGSHPPVILSIFLIS